MSMRRLCQRFRFHRRSDYLIVLYLLITVTSLYLFLFYSLQSEYSGISNNESFLHIGRRVILNSSLVYKISNIHNKTSSAHIVVDGTSYPIISDNITLTSINYESTLFYIINKNDACRHGNVTLIIPIHSGVINFERRGKMRALNQGIYSRDKRNKALLLFFVGVPSNSVSSDVMAIQKKLQEESLTYHDIIQINVEDTYHNVVRKHISVLYWITRYCNNSRYVMKMDDDVKVNMESSIGAMIKVKRKHSNFVIGDRRENRSPHRNKGSKYYIPKDRYPNTTWPPYVAGGLIGYPTSTAVLLYRQAIQLEPIWLDDVFISGICAQKLGIPVIVDEGFRYDHKQTHPNPVPVKVIASVN